MSSLQLRHQYYVDHQFAPTKPINYQQSVTIPPLADACRSVANISKNNPNRFLLRMQNNLQTTNKSRNCPLRDAKIILLDKNGKGLKILNPFIFIKHFFCLD